MGGLRRAAPVADPIDRGAREHYDDAVLYDYEYRNRRRDVWFYRRVASRLCGGPGRVLELACGSGRVTRALARDGHRVVGLDASLPMLERGRARIEKLGSAARSRVSLVASDIRQFAFAERFPLIVMAFNSFEHLYTRVEVAACLERVREHLGPGGAFVFDVQNPSLPWLIRDPRKRWARTRFRHPETGERLVYSTNHDYDPVSQIALIRIYYAPDDASRSRARERVVTLSQRKFFPAELEALVAANGFTVTERYGDFDDEPLGPDHESQVLVCRPRGG